MVYGVVLLLDGASEGAVREVWTALDRAGVPSLSAGTQGWTRPHLSLLVCDQLETEAAVAALAPLRDQPAPSLLFSSLGVFPGGGGVVFLGVVVTPVLLEFHRRVHLAAAGATRTPWEHYLPGHWVPHCTLATPVAPGQMAAVLAAASVVLPMEGRGISLGIVDASTGALTSIGPLATTH